MISLFKTAFKEKKLIPICEVFSLLFLCLFVFDCALTGSGRWLSIGPFSVRMLCFGLSIAFSLPLLWKSKGELKKNPLVIMLAALWIWIAVSAAIGIANGNNMGILIGDIKGFMNLLILPTAICVMKSAKSFRIVLKWIIAAAVLLSLLLITLDIFYVISNRYGINLYSNVAGFLDTSGVLFYHRITRLLVRTYMNSCPYLIVGCVAAIYLQVANKKLSIPLSLAISLFLTAILLEFTRSLLLATGITAVLAFVLYLVFVKESRKIIYKTAIVAAAGLVVMCLLVTYAGGIKNFVPYSIGRAIYTVIPSNNSEAEQEEESSAEEVEIAVAETSGNKWKQVETTASVDIEDEFINKNYDYTSGEFSGDATRKETLDEMTQAIAQSPIIGNGLGKEVVCRLDEGGLSEYIYQDILSKMGIIGFVLYFAPAVYAVYLLIRLAALKNRTESQNKSLSIVIAAVCSIVVFMVVTYFNPYMNAAIGLSCYTVMLAAAQSGYKTAKKESLEEI